MLDYKLHAGIWTRFNMISLHSVILLVFVGSIMSSYLIDGKEVETRKEITKMETLADDPLSKQNNNLNRNSTVGLFYTASTIPSQNLEAYMSTVKPSFF